VTKDNLISIELSKKTKLLMNQLEAHAGTLTVKNSMDLIGNQYRKEVKRIFFRKQVRKSSLKWKKLTEDTLTQKEKLGFGKRRILERTRNLRFGMVRKDHIDNISETGHNFGRFGSKNKYGNFHDDVDGKRKTLPLRNFSIPSETTHKVFLRIIDEDIKGQLRLIGVSVT
jgi:hypothetical protein